MLQKYTLPISSADLDSLLSCYCSVVQVNCTRIYTVLLGASAYNMCLVSPATARVTCTLKAHSAMMYKYMQGRLQARLCSSYINIQANEEVVNSKLFICGSTYRCLYIICI